MADQTQNTIAATLDALRPLRQFPSVASGSLQGSDQPAAFTDGAAWNPPGQFQSIGPTGYAIEGTPIASTTVPTQGVAAHAARNWPMWIIAAAAAVYVIRNH